ncbi:MAG: hypothetical protein K0S74_150 [Chlamydiales bacterium]|jgi:hypothetical protein|nr:hypothetical protein [Chlamydiales bacterium]
MLAKSDKEYAQPMQGWVKIQALYNNYLNIDIQCAARFTFFPPVEENGQIARAQYISFLSSLSHIINVNLFIDFCCKKLFNLLNGCLYFFYGFL